MKIILKSDFIDYYDHWFDTESLLKPDEKHAVFNRNTKSGPSRPAMFKILWDNGIFVPKHGIVKDLYQAPEAAEIVVYTDINAHCGEGKIKMPINMALKHYPNCYYSNFIKDNIPARSYRYLKIGNRAWDLEYQSKDDKWRSNVGDVEIKILQELPAATWKCINLPMFAIDYVYSYSEDLKIAVDLNISPGLKYTGLESILSGKEVYSLIQEWYQTHESALETKW